MDPADLSERKMMYITNRLCVPKNCYLHFRKAFQAVRIARDEQPLCFPIVEGEPLEKMLDADSW